MDSDKKSKVVQMFRECTESKENTRPGAKSCKAVPVIHINAYDNSKVTAQNIHINITILTNNE